MKKSTFILASATVLFALTGCEKKSSVEQQASGELIEKTFYATQGGKEKTSLDPSLATLWSEGDAIKVYPEEGGEGTTFELENGAGESAATFTGLTTLSDAYVAFYPAANAQSISGSTVTFNIPATQVVTEAGSFDTNTVPMVGYTTDNTLAMKNVGSLFEFGLKAKTGTPKVVKIELVGNDGENLAGDFIVDASVSGQPTATYYANGVKTITVNCGEYESDEYKGIEINDSEYTYFYFSIPAGVFTNGFTAVLTGADGMVADVTTTEDIHKDAAKITAFQVANVEFTNCRNCKYTETVTDFCGNTYNLVTIGSQTWMAENMRCNVYYDNTTVPTPDGWNESYVPYYVDRTSGGYGYHYSWAAAMKFTAEESEGQKGDYDGKRQGICPNGFHIPSRQEFNTLLSAAGDDVQYGKHLKSCSGWKYNENGDNKTCFSALPAGKSWGKSQYFAYELVGFWGSDANESDSDEACSIQALYYSDFMIADNSKKYAFSVRCIKD